MYTLAKYVHDETLVGIKFGKSILIDKTNTFANIHQTDSFADWLISLNLHSYIIYGMHVLTYSKIVQTVGLSLTVTSLWQFT